jgi:transposase InsO family protein
LVRGTQGADGDLVLTPFEYALASRQAAPGELIHHADHGAPYTSIKLTTHLVRAGIQASTGSVGGSYDTRLGSPSPVEYEEKYHAGRTAIEQVDLKRRQPALTS